MLNIETVLTDHLSPPLVSLAGRERDRAPAFPATVQWGLEAVSKNVETGKMIGIGRAEVRVTGKPLTGDTGAMQVSR